MSYDTIKGNNGNEGFYAVIEKDLKPTEGHVTLQHAGDVNHPGGSASWDQLQIVDGKVFYHQAGQRTIPLKGVSPEELRQFAQVARQLQAHEAVATIDDKEQVTLRGFFARAETEFAAAKAEGFTKLYK